MITFLIFCMTIIKDLSLGVQVSELQGSAKTCLGCLRMENMTIRGTRGKYDDFFLISRF